VFPLKNGEAYGIAIADSICGFEIAKFRNREIAKSRNPNQCPML
jgi:hypothetical protein